jgi:hypothetical protein
MKAPLISKVVPTANDEAVVMRLTVSYLDAPGPQVADVIDQDSGKSVGYIRSGSITSGGRYVFLFNGAYAARCTSHDECLGFVKGVEVVLNHMLASSGIQPDVRFSAEATGVLPDRIGSQETR